MTTEIEPEPLIAPLSQRQHRQLRPSIANSVMRATTRIFWPTRRVESRTYWAEPELRGLPAFIRPGDHVFDVGAAHGMYTLPLAHLVGPTGAVHSFEPHPRQQRTLRFLRSLVGARHVSVNPAAVGDEVGDRTMRLPIINGFPIYGHAHVTKGTEHSAPAGKVKTWDTPMTSIDAWVLAHGIPSVSFIKVDVEGFEPAVITGARDTIDRFRPTLLLEIEDRHLQRYGRDANQFADEIRATWPDYRMYSFDGTSWMPADRVRAGKNSRNYLFATDSAFRTPRT